VVIKDELEKGRETQELKAQLNYLKQKVETTQDSVTGGKGFCYVNLLSDGTQDRLRVVVINETDYPLYGISFRMWDPADYGKEAESLRTIQELTKNDYNFTVGDLNPHSTRILDQYIRLPAIGKKNYSIAFIARNGSFYEQFILRQIDNSWKSAYRVFSGREYDPTKKLLERTDPSLPKSENGEIEWE
jgi:hypothetical protein